MADGSNAYPKTLERIRDAMRTQPEVLAQSVLKALQELEQLEETLVHYSNKVNRLEYELMCARRR